MSALEVLLAAREDRRARLVDLVHDRAGELAPLPGGMVPEALLGAIAWRESKLGLVAGSRVEPSYLHRERFGGGGLYRAHVPDLVRVYGDSAASSWSSFQIMFPTAWELGFRGAPWTLDDDAVAVGWAMEYVRVRALRKGAVTVEEVADAYNSGSHRDAFVPGTYVAAVANHYERIVRRLDAGERIA